MAPNSLEDRGVAILNHFPAQISGSVTCLEAMRAQSPPKNDALDAQYHAWQVKESCPQVAQDWQISAQHFTREESTAFIS